MRHKHGVRAATLGNMGYSFVLRATGGEEARPVLMWGAMPPPALPVRRPSVILPDPHSPLGLKSEVNSSYKDCVQFPNAKMSARDIRHDTNLFTNPVAKSNA